MGPFRNVLQAGSCLGLLFLFTGCQSLTHTENTALAGTGLGALAGAIIGHQSEHAGEGALVGAVAGGLTGGLVGRHQETVQQRNAALARVDELEQHVATTQSTTALTNWDIMRLSDSGVGDEVIIKSIETSGQTNFDVSPDALVLLKQSHVSDTVIQKMQEASSRPVSPVTPVVSQPKTVIIREEPTPVVVVRPRPYWSSWHHEHWHHRHHHRRSRPGVYINARFD